MFLKVYKSFSYPIYQGVDGQLVWPDSIERRDPSQQDVIETFVDGGLFEAPFGMTLGELVTEIGGGTHSGRPIKAVQVGGPLGAYFPESLFDTPFDYEAFAAKEGLIGHAGVTVFDDTADMLKQARFAMEFCAIESCGKCTPCRIGSTRGVETFDDVVDRGDQPVHEVGELRPLIRLELAEDVHHRRRSARRDGVVAAAALVGDSHQDDATVLRGREPFDQAVVLQALHRSRRCGRLDA